MKLLFCMKCNDVKKLAKFGDPSTYCTCGKSGGRYLEDGLHSEFWGPCILLGFDNPSLAKAIKNIPEQGMGERFEAFVIPKICETTTKLINRKRR